MNAPRKRTDRLTRDELLQAALRILDQEGMSALTMRHLAHEVGVEAMSLYHHVPNKEALLDGVVECLLHEMRVPEPTPEDWMDLMEAMIAEFRRVLVAHPNAAPLIAGRPPSTPATAPYMRVPLQVLAQAGLASEDVVALYQSLLAFAFGHSLLSAQFGGQARAGEEAAGELADALAEWDDQTFRRSVRMLLNGYAES